MTPEEEAMGSPLPKTLLQGRWFEPGDSDVALLPRDVLLDDETAPPNAPRARSNAALLRRRSCRGADAEEVAQRPAAGTYAR